MIQLCRHVCTRLTGCSILLIIACAACTADPPPAALMAPCGARTVPPQPPKSGTRNLTNIANWATKIQLAREATDATLADCAEKHSQLIKWVKEHN